MESYLILWFLGLPVTIRAALSVEILTVAFNNLLFFVPLRVGAQEAGKALVFAMLGLGPTHGFAAGILVRIREMVWALIGLAALSRHQRRQGEATIVAASATAMPPAVHRSPEERSP